MTKENRSVIGDPWVLEVQKWLNKTYGNVSGFGSVPENGKTGWPTVYGIIRGVQHELGITSLADNFGPTTQRLWNEKVPQLLVNGKKHNIIQLIEGAFRCKGLGQGSFKNTYDVNTDYAIKQLKSLAGFENPNNQFTDIWAKALFDMSAFTLVSGGNRKVQEVQKYLNRKYYPYTGILPCDGIYQRETNKALIYGLQAEMGMSTSQANGFFGPGTTTQCPTLSASQGTSANIYLLQAALIVNDEYNGALTGQWTSEVSNAVIHFRNFMKIGNTSSSVADMPVIKALLTTTGDINRPTSACDTSMQILTQSQVNTLKNAGYNTIGRYLTGTVGVGVNERPKNLTANEINLLTNNNFKIFPIYQDGGWYYNYFAKPNQGWQDAHIAGAAAKQLGFKNGTVIYFACDFDVMGHEIPTVVAYMQQVASAMASVFPEYRVSVYGPRNLCTEVMKNVLQVNNCFVSDMSSGFSANLGYKMPSNWSFDQYHEYILNGIPLDKVGMSGNLDVGQSAFNSPVLDPYNVSEYVKNAALRRVANQFSDKLKVFKNNVGMDFTLGVEHVAYTGPLTVKLKVEQDTHLNPDGSMKYKIKNGKPEFKFANDLQVVQDLMDVADADNMFIEVINQMGTICDTGEYKISFKMESLIQVGFEIQSTGIYYVDDINGNKVKYDFTVTLGIFINPKIFPEGKSDLIDSIVADSKAFDKKMATAGVYGGVALTGLALGSAFVVAGGVSGTLNIVSGVVASGTTLVVKVADFFSNLKFVVN